MSDGFITGNDKLQFKELVLQHLNRILEISRHELKQNKRLIITGSTEQTIVEEDYRLIYCQLVENLSIILIPYFDKDIKNKYEKLSEDLDLLDYEFHKKYKEEITELHNELKGKDKELDYHFVNRILVDRKLKSAKKLFRELNLLLKRNNYLKSSIYSEKDLDDGEEYKE